MSVTEAGGIARVTMTAIDWPAITPWPTLTRLAATWP
jgi:hypothetical protein